MHRILLDKLIADCREQVGDCPPPFNYSQEYLVHAIQTLALYLPDADACRAPASPAAGRVEAMREACAKIADAEARDNEFAKGEVPRNSIEYCCAADSASTARVIAHRIRALPIAPTLQDQGAGDQA